MAVRLRAGLRFSGGGLLRQAGEQRVRPGGRQQGQQPHGGIEPAREDDARLVGGEPAADDGGGAPGLHEQGRSEEHTSELQSLMRTSYAVFCLKKKNKKET